MASRRALRFISFVGSDESKGEKMGVLGSKEAENGEGSSLLGIEAA